MQKKDQGFYRVVVVNAVIGMESKRWPLDPRDIFPLLKENDIYEMAVNIKNYSKRGLCWIPQVDELIEKAVSIAIYTYRQNGLDVYFDSIDYELMKEDLLNRLKRRLHKYSGGKRVEIREINGEYGFIFV